ncbi:MAG TPA: DUF3300 domain-containing protein [Bryobacteraceae bacterium]|nr:DUF3300 domain-containing protein [Bryobacteraceae bacterium]
MTKMVIRGSLALLCCFLPALVAQEPPPAEPAAPPAQPLTPDQLDNLVAPIALYPDNLLSQILAASTYPLEIVEAQQWMQRNQKLSGQKLLDEARKQKWDPSVQALVVFPDVIARLNQDVRWTTDLGNAFLAQQADVMAAVQRMRGKAEANGKLNSTPQQAVSTQTQNGQSAITIQPVDPQIVYVPVYDPAYIWGPPVFGYYPPLIYPGIGVGFSFLPGISIGAYFGGFGIWGGLGWGWGPNWFGGSIIINNNFFHRYGFREYHGFGPGGVWAHDPAHRLGVPYANRGVAERFRGGELRGSEFRGGAREPGGVGRNFGGERNASPGARFGSPGFEQRNSGGNHSVFGGIHNGGETRMQSDHGFSTMHGGFGGGGGGAGGGFHGAPSRGGGRR